MYNFFRMLFKHFTHTSRTAFLDRMEQQIPRRCWPPMPYDGGWDRLLDKSASSIFQTLVLT